jgi:hypothetical protein
MSARIALLDAVDEQEENGPSNRSFDKAEN